jgi:predicted dehydrogenase
VSQLLTPSNQTLGELTDIYDNPKRHREVVVALAALGEIHIMCEKPLATTLQDCLTMYRALQSNKVAGGQQAVFAVGHVLRYSPHNLLLHQLVVRDRVIGDVLSVAHTEPVGWFHFAHSYVRGNWYVIEPVSASPVSESCERRPSLFGA